jgi:hypothetical protein
MYKTIVSFVDYATHWPRNENDYAKIGRIGYDVKNHSKSRGPMTVSDPLLQKTDQSAYVPFEHEFKVGSMSLHDGRQVNGYAHA